MLFRLLILVIQSKKVDYSTKINEIEKTNTNHDRDKYICTQELNKLTSRSFVARLGQANLARKNDVAALVKKTDFDDKLQVEKFLQITQNIQKLKRK